MSLNKSAKKLQKTLKSVGINISNKQMSSAVKTVSKGGGGGSSGSNASIPTTSKTNDAGEIINPTANDISTFNQKYTTTPSFKTQAEADQYQKTLKMFSGTTLSNANVIDNKIPANNAKLGVYDAKGATTNAAGQPVNADGSLINTDTGEGKTKNTGYTYRGVDGNLYNSETGKIVEGSANVNDINTESDQTTQDLMDQMRAMTDANTASMISNIQAQFAVRKQQQTDANARANASVTNALLMGGVTGAGSSLQYAPVSSAGIISAQENYGIQQLASLDAEENNLIAQAKAAQMEQNYKLMELKLAQVEAKRKEKIDYATKLNDEIIAANKAQQEATIQASRDTAIADLMTQGITNPSQILDYLNYDDKGNQVGDFTIKEVTDAMTSISKASGIGLDKLTGDLANFPILKSAGMLPPEIASLPDNQQAGAYLRWTKNIKDGKTITPSGTITNINANPTIQDIASLPVSDLTKAIMSGYGKVKDLTPTQKAEVLTEMYQTGYNPQTYVINKLSNLVKLYADIGEESKGYFEGMKWWEKSTNPKVATFESARSVLTREIARLNDVGVLSDQDVATYEGAMPSRRDSDLAVVLNKIAGLASTITQKSTENVGKTVTLKDGRTAIVSFDGETLLDPKTGKELQ